MTQHHMPSTPDSKSSVKLPNFLIIGAAKSGTSSLYKYLEQHPQIYMSPVKEPCFFAFENSDLQYQGPLADKVYNRITLDTLQEHLSTPVLAVDDIAIYQDLFAGVTSERAIGEASMIYMPLADKVIPRIQDHLPHVKLVALLRHPADRAFSEFSMLRAHGREPLKSFHAALAAEPERIAANWAPDWHYTRLGFYHQQLKPYYEAFGAENMFVCLYEDLRRNPEKLLENLFGFLGVDQSFTPDTTKRHNVSGLHPRSNRVHNLMRASQPLKTALRSMLPERIYQRVAKTVLRLNQTKPPTLSLHLRRELIRLYHDDILQLQELIGRDLSHWLSLPKAKRSG